MSTLFLTGATGFLGTRIVEAFLRTPGNRVIALVRAADHSMAEDRLRRAWWDFPALAGEVGKRVSVFAGNIVQPQLGLPAADYDTLVNSASIIIHAAADLRLSAPLAELKQSNVLGTQHVLELGLAAKQHNPRFTCFAYVSTAYVAGNRQGFINENDLSDAYGFANYYEQSKFAAETLVRQAGEKLPVTIFRPGMIVGHSQTGAITTFNTIYYLLRLYLSGRIRLIPVHPGLRINMVPVDYVADAIVRISGEPAAEGLTFHLTAPAEMQPTVAELISLVHEWADTNLDVRLPKPVYLPQIGRLAAACRKLTSFRKPVCADGQHPAAGLRPAGSYLSKMLSLAPYFTERRFYDRSNTDHLDGRYSYNWREYVPRLLMYAVRHGFLHRSERTVHEQALFRMASSSRPVNYFDIVAGRLQSHSLGDVRREIATALTVMRTFGIRPGDAVALVGHNSMRYAAIDMAIGLLGAVSVPLYYTSPAEEIEAILADSRAKMLFIGAPQLIEAAHRCAGSLPVVAFCPLEQSAIAKGSPSKITCWEEYRPDYKLLEERLQTPEPLPDAPATIRYTSGTTGRPKGVTFTHRQLRWMAETIASLPPWTVRHQPVRYLSFLPPSHVVEGILGAYAPYYAPAPVNFYYLRHFPELPAALPIVRPTLFFCVPRFYEKWREKALTSLPSYMSRGLTGNRDGALLHRAAKALILNRAGLNKCSYLIAGSAPVSEDLIGWFGDLGIPVHNAYGLTEAPLITINRCGHLLRGTTGEPLPETEVRITSTGEVWVRGPQVAADAANADGWLHTGDLGHLTEDGGLVITGRLKELIVTSYGKTIAPGRAESYLRELPGVTEAMLYGDNRPYCVALLWVLNREETNMEAIAAGISAINMKLYHPEQVRRWAVLPYNLSIENGTLTANLKLRRVAVAQKYAALIEQLYADELPEVSPDALSDELSGVLGFWSVAV